jgi:sugar-specific transcriptional regulator TrmB
MDNVCEEKHKRIDECLDNHSKRLNNHSERIDKLEQFKSSTEVEIRNLIEQIKSLVQTLKWSMGVIVTTLVAFFIWYIKGL